MHFRRQTGFARRSTYALLLAVLVSGLSAQVSELRRHFGVPEDWTHHRIKFNSAVLRQHPELAAREPRAAAQLYREVFAQVQSQLGTASATSQATATSNTAPHRDWSVSLGNGRIQFGQFPAKWKDDPTLPPSCTADYVIYALNVVGATGGQPSIVGLNNLYAAPSNALCTFPSNQPNFLFTYNTTTIANGRILTSPVLSLDGTKVAFVETSTVGGTRNSVFHTLKIPAPSGTVFTASPSSAPPAGALTSATIAAASNTRSSPWVDYPNDTAYVALDNGVLYKITGVFKGTPTVVTTAPWPITVNAGSTFTSPVLDPTTGRVFMGAGNGRLYVVNVYTPAGVTFVQIGRNGSPNTPGIFDSVMFDATGKSVFAITANDNVLTGAAVVQVDVNTLGILARVGVGLGNSAGAAVNLYDGDFDNNYFSSPATGHMLVCGTGAADTTPYRYLLGFDASGVLQPGSSTQISTNTAARCSPVTEFFNANLSGGTDFFFWGVTRNCAISNGGCVMSLANGSTLNSAAVSGGTSGIVIDNNYVTLNGGSSIHFSSAGAPNIAVKLTQQGLQ